MYIKVIRPYHGTAGLVPAGRVHDVPDALARELVLYGKAVVTDAPAPVAPAPEVPPAPKGKDAK